MDTIGNCYNLVNSNANIFLSYILYMSHVYFYNSYSNPYFKMASWLLVVNQIQTMQMWGRCAWGSLIPQDARIFRFSINISYYYLSLNNIRPYPLAMLYFIHILLIKFIHVSRKHMTNVKLLNRRLLIAEWVIWLSHYSISHYVGTIYNIHRYNWGSIFIGSSEKQCDSRIHWIFHRKNKQVIVIPYDFALSILEFLFP